ncbi:MAG: hypothetical protein ISR76_03320 [Planctomycetes bacterium]|nr:hypothetical protein [Planctomycetota bacterium]
MKLSRTLILLLGAASASACAPPPPPTTRAREANVIDLEAGPKALSQPASKPPDVAPPTSAQSLYLVHVRNAADQIIEGCRVMMLSEIPEPLYLREPRKKTRILYLYSPNYGRCEFMTVADGKPKYLLVGGDGFLPSVLELKPAVGGQTQELTVRTEILPIATVIIEDHQGNRVARPSVTMRPPTGTPNKYTVRGLTANEGMTEIGDDLGEVKFTRPPGKYWLVSARGPDEGGTCRRYQIIDWDGGREPMVVRLPTQSEKTPEWYTW